MPLAPFNWCARSLSINFCIQDTPDYFYMGSICLIVIRVALKLEKL